MNAAGDTPTRSPTPSPSVTAAAADEEKQYELIRAAIFHDVGCEGGVGACVSRGGTLLCGGRPANPV